MVCFLNYMLYNFLSFSPSIYKGIQSSDLNLKRYITISYDLQFWDSFLFFILVFFLGLIKRDMSNP
jgi:hypothetical protein